MTPSQWRTSEDPEAMLKWVASVVPRRLLVLAACAVARLALPYVARREHRPRIAIETAERWTQGRATLEEVRKAAAAATDAAAYAANAAAYAANAAAAAANAAAAADAAARVKTLSACADIVRKHYPRAPRLASKEASHAE